MSVKWDKVTGVSKTHPTLQVVVNPKLRRDSTIHRQAFEALKNLKADYVRYALWYPYPRLSVAELDAPKSGKTSWDFSLIDPIMNDFLAATGGHPRVICFSTVPAWMYKPNFRFITPKIRTKKFGATRKARSCAIQAAKN